MSRNSKAFSLIGSRPLLVSRCSLKATEAAVQSVRRENDQDLALILGSGLGMTHGETIPAMKLEMALTGEPVYPQAQEFIGLPSLGKFYFNPSMVSLHSRVAWF